MMVGWRYRGTFPCLWSGDLDCNELEEKDAEVKLASKTYTDSVRGAKPSNIQVGDIVLLAQSKKSKVDPTCSAERYTVIAREGTNVVVMSKAGIQYARNMREVKKAPETYKSNDSCLSRNLRQRNVIKRPKRFDDQFVYRVFW
ncbi:uncharacterized protein LOC135708779 [Ochlerotatus camptorhynchus]|uniref:uncharacterized protein LOC135708779 n=1 Tax=Ochlerotatus camptorhynchus TaxID=644619 RepID=UPI0031D2E892